MRVITSRNVNDAFVDGRWWLKTAGRHETTRAGEVLVAPGPVVTVYKQPWERILFDPVRDCNPFFHLFETIWMFAGQTNVRPLMMYNKRMTDFAEANGELHGAYGHRWRQGFGFDQLARIVGMLRDEPSTRRAVLTMWSAHGDLGAKKRDLPCNTHCYFAMREGALSMTVCCRSNDMVWGAYGANAVHFSMLHEFICNATGLPMGEMYQFSNNFHIYKEVPKYEEMMSYPFIETNPYGGLKVYPGIVGMRNWQTFLEECEKLMYSSYASSNVTNPFLCDIVLPMIHLWETRDMACLKDMPECDWKVAFQQWMERRMEV